MKVEVRDSGVGLSAEMRGRVFEPFVQAERPLDRADGGSGLGLAIVRGLVEMHAGEVEARSDGEGRGQHLRGDAAPRDPQRAAEQPVATNARAASRGTPRSRKILLVDDNVDAGNVLSAAAHATRPHRTNRARRPLRTRLARDLHPEIALLDIGLPGMDGYALARRIRERASPPVLMALTGYGDAAARQASASAGFERHLVKPIKLEVLAELLERIG